jgi:hypothetical protein
MNKFETLRNGTYIYIYIAYNKWEKDSNDQSICIVGVELDCVRAFPMNSLKFKPNFGLRLYFFNFT